jgi:hypothetical protein
MLPFLAKTRLHPSVTNPAAVPFPDDSGSRQNILGDLNSIKSALRVVASRTAGRGCVDRSVGVPVVISICVDRTVVSASLEQL